MTTCLEELFIRFIVRVFGERLSFLCMSFSPVLFRVLDVGCDCI